MTKFFYKARKGPKKLEQGTIEAESEAAAIRKLTQMGYFPIEVSKEIRGQVDTIKFRRLAKKIHHRDLVTFTRQLSDLLQSGLTLYRALTILHRQTENKNLRIIIQQIADQVKEGQSLSESLKHYPQLFNNMHVNMIRTGEISGSLENVLKRLADFGEKQEDILIKVRQAMVYPIIIFIVGTTTIVFLFTFVIPKLVNLFEDMGQILPLPTRILIGISNLFLSYWWLVLTVFIFVFFAIRRNLFSAKGKIGFDYFKLTIPIWGKFFKRVQIANFSRTLGTMLANGVPILQAIEAVAQILDNEVLKQDVQRIAKEVRAGSSLSKGVSESKYFPVLVSNMVSIAEEGGALDEALLRIASTYEKEIDQSIRLFTSLIEPAMILIIGSIVGFIVVSMMLPIFQISFISG
jgi:type II secretion system protein F